MQVDRVRDQVYRIRVCVFLRIKFHIYMILCIRLCSMEEVFTEFYIVVISKKQEHALSLGADHIGQCFQIGALQVVCSRIQWVYVLVVDHGAAVSVMWLCHNLTLLMPKYCPAGATSQGWIKETENKNFVLVFKSCHL